MAVMLKELVSKITDVELVVLAGQKGLTNPVTWVHMVESEEIGSFIEFGELVFTTGIGLNESINLLQFICKIRERKSSGVIVNLGPYVETIPEEVVEYCGKHDFPLMTVPWKVKMVNIMRVMTFEITNKQLQDMDFEMAMKNAILYPNDEMLYLKTLQSQLIETEASFTCIMLHIEHEDQVKKESKVDKINYLLKNKMGYLHKNAHITTVFNHIVIVVSDSSREQNYAIIESSRKVMNDNGINGVNISYLIGEEVKGIGKLHISYENAGKLLRVKNCYESTIDVVEYESIGTLKLLLEIENKAVIRKYYDDTVRAIVEYDNYHRTDLLEVLEKYLQFDGSLKGCCREYVRTQEYGEL